MEVELEADEAALNCMASKDGIGDGDLGGVEGCTNSVKPEVEDMIWEE